VILHHPITAGLPDAGERGGGRSVAKAASQAQAAADPRPNQAEAAPHAAKASKANAFQ